MSTTKNGKIKIDKNIPEPKSNGRKYPFVRMEVGDSFLFPTDIAKGTARTAASSASRKFTPRKFTVHSTEDGMRCWRIQ